jgi:hypothetical protein
MMKGITIIREIVQILIGGWRRRFDKARDWLQSVGQGNGDDNKSRGSNGTRVATEGFGDEEDSGSSQSNYSGDQSGELSREEGQQLPDNPFIRKDTQETDRSTRGTRYENKPIEPIGPTDENNPFITRGHDLAINNTEFWISRTIKPEEDAPPVLRDKDKEPVRPTRPPGHKESRPNKPFEETYSKSQQFLKTKRNHDLESKIDQILETNSEQKKPKFQYFLKKIKGDSLSAMYWHEKFSEKLDVVMKAKLGRAIEYFEGNDEYDDVQKYVKQLKKRGDLNKKDDQIGEDTLRFLGLDFIADETYKEEDDKILYDEAFDRYLVLRPSLKGKMFKMRDYIMSQVVNQ